MTRRTITVLVIAAMLSLTGCVGRIGTPALSPKVKPPVISRAGVLRAAVDLTYPPFAGTVKGQKVGLDVDVASAIADQLGLKLELVDANPTAAATLVKGGTVDIALGGLTVDASVASQLAFAGTYIADAPGVFAAQGTTTTLDTLGTKRIAVQQDSLAYWMLLDTYGEAPLVIVPSLEDGFKAVVAGKADVLAGDALVGSYMLRSHPTFMYVGQIGSAYPVGVGVSQAKPQLEAQVRSVLDKLASQGVLETLRHKWFGDLATLKVTDTTASQDTSASLGTSTTP